MLGMCYVLPLPHIPLFSPSLSPPSTNHDAWQALHQSSGPATPLYSRVTVNITARCHEGGIQHATFIDSSYLTPLLDPHSPLNPHFQTLLSPPLTLLYPRCFPFRFHLGSLFSLLQLSFLLCSVMESLYNS